MPLPTTYSTGTVTVTEGDSTVTFTGALLGTADAPNLQVGDHLALPSQPLVPQQRLASVDYDAGTAELWVGWPGESASDVAYEVRLVDELTRSTAQTRLYLELLGQLQALGIQPDAVGTLAGRDTYDLRPPPFIYLALDAPWTLYAKQSATDGDWDAGQVVAGIEGPPGPTGLIGDWKGPWLTATAYALGDAVSQGGSSYICLEAHTSATFATDLAASKWEIVAAKGEPGDDGDPGANGVDGKFSGTETIKTAAYTATAADVGKSIILNKATADTLSFEPAATLGSTWMVIVKNIGAGTWTLDPDGAETIDGAATVSLAQGESLVVASFGTALRTMFRDSAAFTQYVPASTSGPASLDFGEDLDNGSNKATLIAPASMSADRVVTLPDATGTLVIGPTSTTNNTIARYSGSSGALKTSSPTINDSGDIFTGGFITGTNQVAARMSGGNATLTMERTDAHGSGVYCGLMQAYGKDSAGNTISFARMDFYADDATDGSEDGSFRVTTQFAGTLAERAKFAAGLVVGSPTGGDKGVGTINATAVYDDNTLLTCMALQREFLETGTVDTDFWDSLVPDLEIPESIEPGRVEPERVVVEPLLEDVLVRQRKLVETDGGYVLQIVEETVQRQVVDLMPVWDEAGNGIAAVEVPATIERVIEARVVPDRITSPAERVERRHELAHRFAAMVADGFDPRDPVAYIARLKADEALPGMPTKAEWQHGGLSTGELYGRLWLATEMLAIVVMNLHERVAALEGATHQSSAEAVSGS